MKKNYVFFLISLFLSAFLYWLYLGEYTTDIQLKDTYVVIPYWILGIFITSLLVFIISSRACISYRFSNKISNWAMVISSLALVKFVVDIFITVKIIFS